MPRASSSFVLIRLRSVSIVGGVVLSGCGTFLSAPDDPASSQTVDGTEADQSNGVLQETVIPPSGDDAATTQITTGTGGDAGVKKNGEDCTGDDDCQSGVCTEGKNRYCTIECDSDQKKDPKCTALGAPFTGECKEGICKR